MLNVITVLIFLISNQLLAQSEIITQSFEPHPFIEILEWNSHKGDLTIEEVMADNPSIWKSEKLNIPFGEKNEVKWFKQNVIIPKDLAGLDVILHIHVDPTAVVYIDGKELFTSIGYSGRGVLALSAKVGKEYSIQVKSQCGGRSSRFLSARLVGMPIGYGRFLSSFTIEPPKDGIFITDWKFKMNVDNKAAQIDYNDSDWEIRKSGNGWRGDMQYGWYRKGITMPKEIDGFKVEGKSVRLLANTNDKGEIWINGTLYQKFRAGDGNVILSNSASVNSTYLIAIKAINEWGSGDVRYAKLITDEAYQIRKAYDEMSIRLNRLDNYCEKHPSPDMSIINKVSDVVEENKNSDLAGTISFVNNAIKSVEAELANNPAFFIPPYLQNLQDDGITIMWETYYPTYGKVLYGVNGKLDMTAKEDQILSTMHEVTLVGLKPNETYNYKVECFNIGSIEQTFKTKSDEKEPFKFVVLGDTRSRHDIHSKIVNRIIEQNPLFIINTGDMVSDGRVLSDWETFFKINRTLMSNTPYYTVLGNHESDSPYYYNYFNLPNNERYYSFNVGDALFVILDSEGKNIIDFNYLSDENNDDYWEKNFEEYLTIKKQYFEDQKKWLEDVLEQNKETGFVFVFQHKPLYTVMKGRAAEAEESRKFWGDIFERYNVQVFFNGHDHHYHHAFKNGVHYITTAGGGAGLYKMDAVQPETIKYSLIEHYVLVNINKDNAVIDAIDINGNEIEKIIVKRRNIK
ncbi:MAG: metallophosphoesterase family protein [Chlorobi bacterium]|nr:metallophosphoesterase family protein [Chlorobiota bacterium]